jgi:probable H4MPT-linked C1 transfer pathway protein
MTSIIGWDIGAANVKAVRWGGQAGRSRTASRPFEIWREKSRLGEVLQSVQDSVVKGVVPDAMAVTMTAELSDVFETKREGVLFVLSTFRKCFPAADTHVFGLSGEFVPLEKALARPLDFAASNWLAAAVWIARQNPDCLYIDVGSTTTDILPIVAGQVCVRGRSDLDRLSSGELVYTGAQRTNLAAIVQSIPISGRIFRVASEHFAISGDVHLILGNLNAGDYTCATPDGQLPSVDSARARLARLVCADVEMLSTGEIDEMAQYISTQQVFQIGEGIEQVLAQHRSLRDRPVIVSGLGSFLAVAAAKSVGLEIGHLEGSLRREELVVAPCLAVAQLLAEHLGSQSK